MSEEQQQVQENNQPTEERPQSNASKQSKQPSHKGDQQTQQQESPQHQAPQQTIQAQEFSINQSNIQSIPSKINKNDEIDDLFINENDPEQIDMIKQYNSVKKDRKNVENNERLLQNRIELLKHEEQRTLKKIEETRKKALEIYYLKLKNEEKKKKKEQEKEQQQKKQEVVDDQRKQQQKEHQIMIDRKKQTKKEEVDKMKRISAAYQVKISTQKSSNQQRLSLQRMEIYSKKQDVKKNIEQLRKQKRQQIVEDLRKKVDYEGKIKQWKERQIEQLENFEMELIQRLQNTSQMQKTAFDELESALTLPAKEFAEKYLKPRTQHSQVHSQYKQPEQNSADKLPQSDEERSHVSSKKSMTHVRSQPVLEPQREEQEEHQEEQQNEQPEQKGNDSETQT